MHNILLMSDEARSAFTAMKNREAHKLAACCEPRDADIFWLRFERYFEDLYYPLIKVYGERIKLTLRTISTTATSSELALKAAFNKLLKQSSNLELTTTIPQQTRLLDLRINDNNIYIDLSQEFNQGGGSSSMIYRVAQVLYTATSINPQASVFLSIEGQPLNENYPLGGEGLLLEYPLTRQKFTMDFLFDLYSYLN